MSYTSCWQVLTSLCVLSDKTTWTGMVLAYCNLEQDRSGNVRSVKLPGGLAICKFNSSRPSDEVLLHEALIKPPLILTAAFNRTKVDLLSIGCQKRTWKSQLKKYKISYHENLFERVRNIDQFAQYSIHYKIRCTIIVFHGVCMHNGKQHNDFAVDYFYLHLV